MFLGNNIAVLKKLAQQEETYDEAEDSRENADCFELQEVSF